MDKMIVTFNKTGCAQFTVTDRHGFAPGSEGYEYEVIIRANMTYKKTKKTRFYIGGEDKVDFSEAQAMSEAAGSQMRGESVEADKAWDAANRQVVKNQRDVMEQATMVSNVVREMVFGHKFNFNKKAGCSCGCSPAFVADDVLTIGTVTNNWNGEPVFRVVPIESICVMKRERVAEPVAA